MGWDGAERPCGGAACSETDLLGWLRDENRQKGPQCFIGFAVSAPMVAPLKAEMAQRDQSVWQIYRQDAEAVLEGAAPAAALFGVHAAGQIRRRMRGGSSCA